mmetsp:Transcript_16087/g.30393  ORF Transcript_16087/g.30393 Transcript_16087/m.30393 type:complete len:119 (-) Transcript_16087:123-479(-)
MILYKLENGIEVLPEDIEIREEAPHYMDHLAKIKRRWLLVNGDVMNEFGQLGHLDDIADRKHPSLILTLRNQDIVEVAFGESIMWQCGVVSSGTHEIKFIHHNKQKIMSIDVIMRYLL